MIKTEYGSICCRVNTTTIKPVIVATSKSSKHYYYSMCNNCDALTERIIINAYDSNNNKIEVGDILEVYELPIDHAEKYHAVFLDENNGLEIRDLGCNNVHSLDLYKKVFTLGHFSKHLEKVSDEDLFYYWNTKREIWLNNETTK